MAHTLTGITWDHSRALPPLVATAQRYEETHPGVRINWQKRTLHEFGHMPIDLLAENFDLIVIDHPWAGYAFEQNLVLDLFSYLNNEQVNQLAAHSIGKSYESYVYGGKLLAVPIDAATPVPSYRPDLLQKANAELPRTFSDLIHLARRGLAIMPGFAPDLYLNFLMICYALDGSLFADREMMVDHETGLQALELLRQLSEPMPREVWEMHPICIGELLSTTDDFALCAFAYTYNNYARPHFSCSTLRYLDLVTLDDGRPLRSIIGGTGIAVSTRCENVQLAVDYALFTGSAEVQRGIYALSGGQPSRVEAWNDDTVNTISGNFFRDTRRAQEQALVRPRYDGYVPLQEEGGAVLMRCLRDGEPAARVIDFLDGAYRRSLPRGTDAPEL